MLSELAPLGDRTGITDLGCKAPAYLEALPAVAAVVTLFLLMIALGGLVGGRQRWKPADLLSGWSLLTVIFTLCGIHALLPLSYAAALLGALAVAVAARSLLRREAPVPLWLLIAIGLQFWILALINLAGLTGWDDFAHWSLNALYLWRHDSLPQTFLAESYARFPGYPYAMPYLGYSVSLLTGSFVTQGGAMAAWLLLTGFAFALSEIPPEPRSATSRWTKGAWLALAMLMVTVLNPGFNASFTITSGSDLPTAFVVGMTGLLLMRLHMALSQRNAAEAHALAFQLAAAAIVLVMLRQMNVVLLALLAGGFLVMARKDGVWRKAMIVLCLALLPALLLRFVWQDYVTHTLPDGGFGVLPFADWRWEKLPVVLNAAFHEMLKKSGLFALLIVTAAYGLRNALRSSSPARVFAFMTATAFLGYIGFLLLSYIAASTFLEHEINRAASFYRYSTHLSLLGVAALWLGLRPWLEQKLKSQYHAGFALACLAVLPLVSLIKPAVLVPQSRPQLCASRALGQSLARSLPPQSGLLALDPNGNGFQPYIINYELALDDARQSSQSHVVAAFDNTTREPLESFLTSLASRAKIDAVAIEPPVTDAKSAMIRAYFGLQDIKPGTLLLRDGSIWKPVSEP